MRLPWIPELSGTEPARRRLPARLVVITRLLQLFSPAMVLTIFWQYFKHQDGQLFNTDPNAPPEEWGTVNILLPIQGLLVSALLAIVLVAVWSRHTRPVWRMFLEILIGAPLLWGFNVLICLMLEELL
jgi:hypothetical protein